MIVSHQHRYIFMKTLKTAGTSVEIALSRECGPDDIITPLQRPDEVLRREAGGRAPQNFEDDARGLRLSPHTKANAVAEAVGPEVWGGYHKFVVERNPWDAVVSLYYWVNRHDGALSFDQFLATDHVSKLAMRNQRAWHIRGKRAVDTVLRYESLAEDLASVWHELDLPGEPHLPHAKGGLRKAGSYRDLYDDASRDLVATAFAKAIRELKYTF